MKKRIITAVVALSIFIPICIFSDLIVFPIIIGMLSTLAVYESLKCTGIKNIPVYIISLAVALSAPILSRVIPDHKIFALIYCGTIFCFLILCFGLSVFSKGRLDLKDISVFYSLFIYIVTSFSCIVLLRDMTLSTKYAFLLVFIIPWVSDSFAYFIGVFFGKHKLIPDISPKKTVEGSIGGLIGGGISFLVFELIAKSFNVSVLFSFNIFLIGIGISFISQIGDLVASHVKRIYGIKDYGNILPGHGGVMDRFDSVLITAPILYMVAAIAEFIGKNI